MNATATVEALLEGQPETATLAGLLYHSDIDQAEEWVVDMFSAKDTTTPLPIEERNPATLVSCHGKPIPRCIGHVKSKAHREHVAHYRTKPGPPIIVAGNRILDGNHRALAAYVEKRNVLVVDTDNLPD